MKRVLNLDQYAGAVAGGMLGTTIILGKIGLSAAKPFAFITVGFVLVQACRGKLTSSDAGSIAGGDDGHGGDGSDGGH